MAVSLCWALELNIYVGRKHRLSAHVGRWEVLLRSWGYMWDRAGVHSSPWLLILRSHFDTPGWKENRDILPGCQHPAGGNPGHLNFGIWSLPSCLVPSFHGWEPQGRAQWSLPKATLPIPCLTQTGVHIFSSCGLRPEVRVAVQPWIVTRNHWSYLESGNDV